MSDDFRSKSYQERLVDGVYEVLKKHMESRYPTNLLLLQNIEDLKALAWDLVKTFKKVEQEEVIKFNSVKIESNSPKNT